MAIEDSILQWMVCSGFAELKVNTPRHRDPVMVPCDKKLAKININSGHVQIKCHKCSTVNDYHKTLEVE